MTLLISTESLINDLVNSKLSIIATAFISLLVYRFYIFPRYVSSLKDVQGPQGGSFFSGHLSTIMIAEPGSVQQEWSAQYGNVYKYLDFLGNEELFLADPKALAHVLVHKTYDYPKPQGLRDMLTRILGEGIVFVEGDQHKRQRRVLNAAFTQTQINAYLPTIQHVADKLVSKFSNTLDSKRDKPDGGAYTVINVHKWLARATLDIIGLTGFNYSFGGLDQEQNELASAFSKLLTAKKETALQLFLKRSMLYIPFVHRIALAGAQQSSEVMQREGKIMLDMRKEQAQAGELDGEKDLLSLIVKANLLATNPKDKLRDDEIMGQITTFTVAGHETSSVGLTWLLHYLALYPEVQEKLRAEIHEVEEEVAARGDTEFSVDDLSKLKYLDAVLRETLRLAPPLYYTNRQAAKDDVIPLSKPIKGSNGQEMTSIPVKKGQMLIIGIYVSNKNKDIFGDTADEFDPERWMVEDKTNDKSEQGVNFATWSPLLTFLAGSRGCIGYRLALMEMKVITLALVSNFEFKERDEGGTLISRNLNSVIRPLVVGEEEDGMQLPLRVRKVDVKECVK